MAAQDTTNPPVLVSPVSTHIEDLNTAKACSQTWQTLIWFSPTLKLWFTTTKITEGWFALPSLPTSLPRPHMKVMQQHNKNQTKCHLLLHAHKITALGQGPLCTGSAWGTNPKTLLFHGCSPTMAGRCNSTNFEASYIHLKTDTYSCHFSRTE